MKSELSNKIYLIVQVVPRQLILEDSFPQKKKSSK